MNEVAIQGERVYEGLVEEIITTLQEGRARAIASWLSRQEVCTT